MIIKPGSEIYFPLVDVTARVKDIQYNMDTIFGSHTTFKCGDAVYGPATRRLSDVPKEDWEWNEDRLVHLIENGTVEIE